MLRRSWATREQCFSSSSAVRSERRPAQVRSRSGLPLPRRWACGCSNGRISSAHEKGRERKMVVQRVFHPTDFSAGANAALRLALEVVDRFGAELLVGHVAPGVGADSSKANELERRLKDLVEG